MQTGVATVESSMEITQKIKNESAFWHSDPTCGNISKETQNINSKGHKHPYVHCSVIYSLQDMEAAQVSTTARVDETTREHTLEHDWAWKKTVLPSVTAWMDLENIMLSEIIQSETDKYHIFLLICGIYWTN